MFQVSSFKFINFVDDFSHARPLMRASWLSLNRKIQVPGFKFQVPEQARAVANCHFVLASLAISPIFFTLHSSLFTFNTAKLLQNPPTAKNRPIVTCKNLLIKSTPSVKIRKQYLSAAERIFFPHGSDMFAWCYRLFVRGSGLLRCYGVTVLEKVIPS